MDDLPALRHPSTSTHVVAVSERRACERPDEVITEEPMEIRLAGPGQHAVSVAVTMRTPTADFELAVGFLHSEGLLHAGEVRSVRYCDTDTAQRFNIVTVGINRHVDTIPMRNFALSASCGVCGKTSLDELATRCPRVSTALTVPGSLVASLADRLRRGQRLFTTTGGLHAAGLFDALGRTLVIREDVGRHNAVDKVIGHGVLGHRLPLNQHLLMVSGRISFEIVEKAAMAGISVVGAVSAPTSLAIDAARRFGVTLVGFIRDDRFTIYANPQGVDALA